MAKSCDLPDRTELDSVLSLQKENIKRKQVNNNSVHFVVFSLKTGISLVSANHSAKGRWLVSCHGTQDIILLV